MLTHRQLDGFETVKVFDNEPSTGRVFRGHAQIREVLDGDRQGVCARYTMEDDPQTVLTGWIFASDQ